MRYLIHLRLKGHSHINLPTICVKMTLSCRPTHPVPLTFKLPKIDVYNFRYKISEGILIKLFFLSHNPQMHINRQIHKLVHKQIYHIASSAHITSMPFLVPTFRNSHPQVFLRTAFPKNTSGRLLLHFGKLQIIFKVFGHAYYLQKNNAQLIT